MNPLIAHSVLELDITEKRRVDPLPEQFQFHLLMIIILDRWRAGSNNEQCQIFLKVSDSLNTFGYWEQQNRNSNDFFYRKTRK